jgi:hypothetical protein
MVTTVVNLPEGFHLPADLGIPEDAPVVVNILNNITACIVWGTLRAGLDTGGWAVTPNTTPPSPAQFAPEMPEYTLPSGDNWGKRN